MTVRSPQTGGETEAARNTKGPAQNELPGGAGLELQLGLGAPPRARGGASFLSGEHVIKRSCNDRPT